MKHVESLSQKFSEARYRQTVHIEVAHGVKIDEGNCQSEEVAMKEAVFPVLTAETKLRDTVYGVRNKRNTVDRCYEDRCHDALPSDTAPVSESNLVCYDQ